VNSSLPVSSGDPGKLVDPENDMVPLSSGQEQNIDPDSATVPVYFGSSVKAAVPKNFARPRIKGRPSNTAEPENVAWSFGVPARLLFLRMMRFRLALKFLQDLELQ
jgi:hypothetical protein